jgi:hypothetical protein
VDRRLLSKIGEKYDTYHDRFKEYVLRVLLDPDEKVRFEIQSLLRATGLLMGTAQGWLLLVILGPRILASSKSNKELCLNVVQEIAEKFSQIGDQRITWDDDSSYIEIGYLVAYRLYLTLSKQFGENKLYLQRKEDIVKRIVRALNSADSNSDLQDRLNDNLKNIINLLDERDFREIKPEIEIIVRKYSDSKPEDRYSLDQDIIESSFNNELILNSIRYLNLEKFKAEVFQTSNRFVQTENRFGYLLVMAYQLICSKRLDEAEEMLRKLRSETVQTSDSRRMELDNFKTSIGSGTVGDLTECLYPPVYGFYYSPADNVGFSVFPPSSYSMNSSMKMGMVYEMNPRDYVEYDDFLRDGSLTLTDEFLAKAYTKLKHDEERALAFIDGAQSTISKLRILSSSEDIIEQYIEGKALSADLKFWLALNLIRKHRESDAKKLIRGLSPYDAMLISGLLEDSPNNYNSDKLHPVSDEEIVEVHLLTGKASRVEQIMKNISYDDLGNIYAHTAINLIQMGDIKKAEEILDKIYGDFLMSVDVSKHLQFWIRDLGWVYACVHIITEAMPD